MSALTEQDAEDLEPYVYYAASGNEGWQAVQRIVDRHTAPLERSKEALVAKVKQLQDQIALARAEGTDGQKAMHSYAERAKAAEAKLAAIDVAHFTNKGGLFCVTCGNPFPCYTSRIIHDNPKEET